MNHRCTIRNVPVPMLLAVLALQGCTSGRSDEPTTTARPRVEALRSSSSPEAARPGKIPVDDTAKTGLKLIVEPFADFYFLVRAEAAGVVEAEPELQPIIDAWMPVQDEIGTFGGFWRFDLGGLGSKSPAEFANWFEDFPDELPGRAGGVIPIRVAGLAMAEAMKTSWPQFRDERWPGRKTKLESAVERLDKEFMPKHRQALRYMLDSLGIADPEIEVPMHLVLEAHPPGASTYRGSSGPVAVLSINDLLAEGRFSDLEETLLHETCHALDLASEGETDVFTVLRRMLRDSGMNERDQRLHDIPHLVMFVQAENTMRRLYDPNHVAYGDTWRGDIAPLYERSGEAAVAVRRAWSDFLDGEKSRQEALAEIVETLAR